MTALAPGPTNRWHYGGTVDVTLYNADASSALALDVLSGANAVALQSVEGTWEIVQFREAELVGPGTYRLSVLLRGQLGTEDATAAGIDAGVRVVVLDGTLAALPFDLNEVGLTRTYRVGPLAEGVGGANATTFDFVGTARGLTPYAPVHGEARLRTSDDALLLSWVRRTRVGGDVWAAGDVPLGESAESYQLEILDGSTVVRTVVTSEPTYTYSAADQTADFGARPDPVSFRVGQYSPGVTLGTLHEVTVDVKQP